MTINLVIEQNPGQTMRLLLAVKDNGQGCCVTKIKSGFGLLSMQERVNGLGGEFAIQTQPDQGMKVLVTLPLS